MPRHAKSDADEEAKFTEPVTVRFSEPQMRALERLAKRTGLKVSTFIRVKALETVPWERDEKEDD